MGLLRGFRKERREQNPVEYLRTVDREQLLRKLDNDKRARDGSNDAPERAVSEEVLQLVFGR